VVEDVVTVVVGCEAVVVVVVTHMHSAEQTAGGVQRSAPEGELGSHSSPGSTLPLPQVPPVVVVVLVVDVVDVVLASVTVVVEDVVTVVVEDVVTVVVGCEAVVVVVVTHTHCAEQIAGGVQRSAPEGELGSHCSSPSTLPSPQVLVVLVVLVVTVMVVLDVVV